MENHPQKIDINVSNGTIIRIILFGLLIFALFKLYNIILIILTAIVIASFVEYAVVKMRKYINNRTLIIFIIYSLTISILVALSSVFLPVFIEEMSLLVDSIGKYIPNQSLLNTFQPETITGVKEVVSSISSNSSISDVIKSSQHFINSISGGFFNVFGQAFGGILNLILIFILSLFFSLTERGVENFLRIITPEKQEEYVIKLWQRTERKIGLWFQGQVLLGLIMGVFIYLVLTIIGVRYALVLALLTAFCELIPFGIFVAMIPGAIFAYLDGGVTMSVITLFAYLILHQFENYLIYPLIVKNVIGISPLVVILSVLIGGSLAGFWGIVLAIPVAVCLLEFMDDVEKKKVLNRNS